MSVYSSLSKSGPYVADGKQVNFPYGFYALDPSHVAVFVDTERVASGLGVTIGYTGGTVTFDVPPPAGKRVTILRDVPFTQENDWQNNTAFYPEIIETAFDKLTMMVQQLQETVATIVNAINANNGVGGNGDVIIAGGNISNTTIGTTAYQFSVVDTSARNSTGNVLSKQVSVVHGRSPAATSCGTLNGVKYDRTDLPLADGVTQYYIYASGGRCYALRHELHSDIVPTLLLATVTFAADGSPRITQESYADNPTVKVWSGVCGSSTITAEPEYDTHVLNYNYKVSATVLRDSEKLTLPETEMPTTAEGSTGFLVAYVRDLVVAPDTVPDAGLQFVESAGATPSVAAEWYQPVLTYKLREDGASQYFHIVSRLENPYLFTFTTLPLDAKEAGV